MLSRDQISGLKVLNTSSRNVFLTGYAGSGKSFLLEHWLTDKSPDEYVRLASTGVAAVHIGGRTVHSFFGFGPADTKEALLYSWQHRSTKYKKELTNNKQIPNFTYKSGEINAKNHTNSVFSIYTLCIFHDVFQFYFDHSTNSSA